VARGSTTVHASFGKVKVRRVNSGGARKFHLGAAGRFRDRLGPGRTRGRAPAGARGCATRALLAGDIKSEPRVGPVMKPVRKIELRP
jgi:hypothetical protein